MPKLLTHTCCLENCDVTHAIRDTIPVIFLTHPAMINIIFFVHAKQDPGQTPYQNQFPNIYGKKLHQIFHQVRIELLSSSLVWHILGIPQHYSASNLISRWLPTVTQVLMPNLHHAKSTSRTIPASSMWPKGPLAALVVCSLKLPVYRLQFQMFLGQHMKVNLCFIQKILCSYFSKNTGDFGFCS